ncbi:PHD finger protein 3 isoform X2 [Gouania willdenowi]|uniref:PHD finger protein 3 isoform X2 n=1 Tax=Gouania willdenowi TaxID=441366 RepID=UPI0010560E3C|nr:PHD finger protein 3 isoform X2 [Gouania willdenowi]
MFKHPVQPAGPRRPCFSNCRLGPDVGSASAGLTAGLTLQEPTEFKRPVGRPKKNPLDLASESEGSQCKQPNTQRRADRKPTNRLSETFLIEKGVKGVPLKNKLTLGGRINVNDLEGALWLNPTVVLRRLTVTIGGFRIELLPGPSYSQTVDTATPEGFDGFAYDGDISYSILPDETVNDSKSVIENVGRSSADDSSLGLGPYVNPNDVQTPNGTLIGSACPQETKVEKKDLPLKQKAVTKGKDNIKKAAVVCSKTDSKETQQTVAAAVAKTVLKSKQELILNKDKNVVLGKPSSMSKEQKGPQNTLPKALQRGDEHKMKSLKEKQNIAPLKRPASNPQSEHASKVQKIQGTGNDKVGPKSPSASNPVGKNLASTHRTGEHPGFNKQAHLNSSKAESAPTTHSQQGNNVKTLEDGVQEKSKVKKPDKIIQRQKSRNSRSISVEEPQLFIPDNAPVVKKENPEEQPANTNTETVWDGNNCCGLCKKHHNNMFMVGCGRCDDWFHGDCVGLDLTKVREMEEQDQMYVCLKCCEEESKKPEAEPEPPCAPKPEVQMKSEAPADHKRYLNSQPGPSRPVKLVRKDSDRRQSMDGREAAHKAGPHHKHETKSKTSSASKKPVSQEAIRRNVRDTLKDILIQRLKESDLKVSVERASEVAKKTERELFHLYKDTDNKYKNKYRSLTFNLKDNKNNVLFKRVLKGEISPSNLIRMSPEELASKELAAWRQRENRHTIEMIEKEQREVERRPITKITHKGEIEIESQEPVKTTDPVEFEPPPIVMEVSAELLKPSENKTEITKTEKDTTSQHKAHLFDLHCKICTGRMALPVEDATTKVLKVATSVVQRPATKPEETKSTTQPTIDDDLHLTVLEESFRNARSSSDGRLDLATGKYEAISFISTLKTLWRGFIHMHSVAKLVTKAFPVSGVLDHLTEDLPDSIQVGGRISPQMVWDYFEKIRATGTKEVCLIRFSPETEEDEISYTLLYAYFSSRKRFGVVSNNTKQVKDMYLIPLGATEKVPHQLVPFDGPGLESNRCNLLLGLIIRQRPKREPPAVDVNEAERIIPKIKPVITTKDTREAEEEEKLYLSSLIVAPPKEEEKAPISTEEVEEPSATTFTEPSAPEENVSLESQKPLRFLPGVLVGWGGELPPLPDVGGKPAPTANDTQRTKQQALKTEPSTGHMKSPTAAAPRERFVIKKKEVKPVKTEMQQPSTADGPNADKQEAKNAADVSPGSSVSLKDKPPHVSTEAFLASLSTAPTGTETSSMAPTDKNDEALSSEISEGNVLSQSKSQAASNETKFPLSGILKKSSAYSTVNEATDTLVGKDKTILLSKPAPVSSSTRNDLLMPFHQGYLQLGKTKHKQVERNVVADESLFQKKEDLSTTQASAEVAKAPHVTKDQEAQATSHTLISEPKQEVIPESELSSPVPDAKNNLVVSPSQNSSMPAEDQNSLKQWTQDSSSHALPGLTLQQPESYSDQSSKAGSQTKHQEERYHHPWDWPRNSEDEDYHERQVHHSHHSKKSRHKEREREKKHERSYDSKHRDRSRHRGHSEDRYGEKRKERHHSDGHSSRQRDRHRHRRDSDNGRRSSKDSSS